MITNELEQGEFSKASQRKKVKSSEQQSTNIAPLRTFHMHSSRSLQLVVTRTLLNMLDTISKTLALSDSSAQTIGSGGRVDDEYETYELEEEMLLEKFKTRRKDQDESTSHLNDANNKEHDDDNENLSFNFLVKNQLGVDVHLESLQGFHVLFYILRIFNLISLYINLIKVS